MRTIAIGRIVGLIIAVVGIACSVYYAGYCVYRYTEFHRWLDARPMESAVDLSKPGEITVPFRQTCGISHGEAIYLKLTPDLDDNAKPEELLKELSARLVVKDRDGNELENAKIDKSSVHRRNGSRDIIIAGFVPFRAGDYVATVKVEAGASILAGRGQVIYAKYHLCGLEQFPALIAGAFSLGAGIIGLVAAVCVLPGLLRCGIRRDVRAGRESTAERGTGGDSQ